MIDTAQVALTPEERKSLRVAVSDRLTELYQLEEAAAFDSVRTAAKEQQEILIRAATKLGL